MELVSAELGPFPAYLERRATMLDSNLPIKFWADYVESTSLIINEVPSTPLYIITYQASPTQSPSQVHTMCRLQRGSAPLLNFFISKNGVRLSHTTFMDQPSQVLKYIPVQRMTSSLTTMAKIYIASGTQSLIRS
jgi:hypothetical protein